MYIIITMYSEIIGYCKSKEEAIKICFEKNKEHAEKRKENYTHMYKYKLINKLSAKEKYKIILNNNFEFNVEELNKSITNSGCNSCSEREYGNCDCKCESHSCRYKFSGIKEIRGD